MASTEIQSEINAICQEITSLESEASQAIVKKLLNLIERIAGENARLGIELQQLKDENNRLKGEQGKPVIKANKPKNEDI